MEQNQTEKTADKNIFYFIFIKRLHVIWTYIVLLNQSDSSFHVQTNVKSKWIKEIFFLFINNL